MTADTARLDPGLPDAAALVVAEDISRVFGRRGLFGKGTSFHAVSNVSFSVGHREIVGLVGESGSGKSTIGRMLLGVSKPDGGRVLLDGQDVQTPGSTAHAKLRRATQMIFQDPYSSLDPRRRIADQLADPLKIHAIVPASEVAGRVASLLEAVGLTAAQGSRYPHEFSGGQRQRISIARALATEPRFIVADEPVSALDVSVQAQILQLLVGLRNGRDLSLLFISHDLAVVRILCDRVIVLYLGRVMEEGTAAEIFERPAHPYTKALLSAAPRAGISAAKKEKLVLKGDPPSPTDPPSGCVFRTRCPFAIEACAATIPPRRSYSASHHVACIRADELRKT